MGTYTENPYIDPIIKLELDKIKNRVLHRDMDYVGVIDGDEGSGKSVLIMQWLKYMDPTFNLDRIVFKSDDFIKLIKDPKLKCGSAILLDEAYNAANSRASMSEVNRSMIAIATEMRQRNLIVFVVLPSFFDLDRALAIHRTRCLVHVYFGEDYERGQYIVFPKTEKRELFIAGKKKYDYTYPRSPFPPLRFLDQYVIDEKEYRFKKGEAFRKRTVSNQAKKWLEQRNSYIKYIYETLNLSQEDIGKIPSNYGVSRLSNEAVSFVLKTIIDESLEK